MKLWPVKLVRLSTLVCVTLFFALYLLPDRGAEAGGKGGGKKRVTPVKHLFGVGIGYQRVVHYKPVLVFSNHRRPKRKRRPGWGWGRGKKGWSPVVVHQHVIKHGHGHHRHGGGGGQHHHHHHHHTPKKRTKSYHRYGGSHQSYRGWGWKPTRRNPHKGYSYSYHSGSPHEHEHSNGGSEYHHGEEYGAGEGEAEWSSGGSPGLTSHNSPFGGSGNDYLDDHGGYESEVKEQWNKHNNRPLRPLVFPGTTVSDSPPSPPSTTPLYPFADSPPKSDTSVANIRKDFLKNHLKNFQEFNGYQREHSNKDSDGNRFPPRLMKPPEPDYSTSNTQGPEETDVQYYDDYYGSNDRNMNQQERGDNTPDSSNYDVVDEDGFNWSELNRKMAAKAVAGHAVPPTQSPSIVYGTPAALASNQNNIVLNAPVQTHMQVSVSPTHNTQNGFKPSPSLDQMGSGSSFNEPGFFPTFDQFQRIEMN